MSGKKVVKNSVIYVFNNILVKAFNFLLLPLYTAYLTTEDYGTTNLISSFTAVASFIVAFSLYSAIVRFYADLKEDRQKVKRFFGTIILFVFFSGVVFLSAVAAFHELFISLLFKGLAFYPTVLVSLLGLVFGCLYTVYQYILKGMEKAKKSATTSIFYFFLQLALNILFVVYLRWGANGVLCAALLTNILCFIYMMVDLKTHDLITLCIDRPMLKEALRYSVPLLPHNLSTHITSLISRIFINNSFSLSSVGLFGLASQFGSVTDMIQASVNIAFQPWFYDKMNKREKNYKREIVQLSDTLVWVYGIIFLFIALFSQEAILLFTNENYSRAWTVVPLLVMTFSIKTIYYFYINILFYYKKATKFIFTATLSSSLLNVVLSALFIPWMDMYGSVLADAIAMVLRVGIVVFLSKRFETVGYKTGKFIYLTIINLIFIGAGLIFSYTRFMYEISWLNLLYKIMVLTVYLGLAYRTNKKAIDSMLRAGEIFRRFRRKTNVEKA